MELKTSVSKMKNARRALAVGNQSASSGWMIEKARRLQENICFVDYTKTFDCVDHNKLWKILKEMGILDHFLLRKLYAGQENIFIPHKILIIPLKFPFVVFFFFFFFNFQSSFSLFVTPGI